MVWTVPMRSWMNHSGTQCRRAAKSPREQLASTVCADRFVRQDSGVGQVRGGFMRVSRNCRSTNRASPMYQADPLAAPNREEKRAAEEAKRILRFSSDGSMQTPCRGKGIRGSSVVCNQGIAFASAIARARSRSFLS
jgi:hypothetical protein